MATDIGPKIGIDGEKEFRKELTAINAQLRALAAEGKTVEATYDGQTESVESLTAKSKVLNQQIETQRKAIEKIEYALQKARESYDENDEHVQKWKAVLANANTQLVAMEKQLEKTKIGLEEVSEGFQKASSRLNTAGNALTVGLTTPLVAAGAAAVNYASDTEEAAEQSRCCIWQFCGICESMVRYHPDLYRSGKGNRARYGGAVRRYGNFDGVFGGSCRRYGKRTGQFGRRFSIV